MFTALESVGGFNASLMHIGLMIVYFFQERLFKSAFLRQLYQVPAELKEESKRITSEEMLKNLDDKTELDDGFLNKLMDFIL